MDSRSIELSSVGQVYSLDACYDMFMLDARARHCTPRTLATYDSRLKPFIHWCDQNGVKILSDVTPSTIRLYIVHIQDEKQWASRTVNGVVKAIATLFNYCVRDGLLTESPMKKVIIPKVDKKILPAFTEDDVQKILRACESERDEAIVLFLLDTGLRATELINLNAGDIETKTGAVYVRLGKGRKDRTVYVGARPLKQLLRYRPDFHKLSESAHVWRNEWTGERLTDSGLRQLLERVGERASVKHCSPHTFRRTFALWSLRNGMSIYHLQRLMGHADISVLRQYLDLVQADLQVAHEQYGVVDNLLSGKWR